MRELALRAFLGTVLVVLVIAASSWISAYMIGLYVPCALFIEWRLSERERRT